MPTDPKTVSNCSKERKTKWIITSTETIKGSCLIEKQTPVIRLNSEGKPTCNADCPFRTDRITQSKERA